jgi:hypothetical protein
MFTYYNECFGVTYAYMPDVIDPYNSLDEKKISQRLNMVDKEEDSRPNMTVVHDYYNEY